MRKLADRQYFLVYVYLHICVLCRDRKFGLKKDEFVQLPTENKEFMLDIVAT